MIVTLYQSPFFQPDNIHVRCVKYHVSDQRFHWTLTCVKSMRDVKQGVCDETDLPPDIAAAARARCKTWPSYVDWPMM